MSSTISGSAEIPAPNRLDLIATCAFGLEAIVRRELQSLGYVGRVVSPGRVHFIGDLQAVCRANLWLRCADRVLIQIESFEAADFETLFETVRKLPWERWIGVDAAFPVIGRSAKSTLTSVPAVQRSVKKAIVLRLQDAYRRSELPETGPEYKVEVALLSDRATLTLDTTGPSLHKRGYRSRFGEAPIKETLAAAMVMLSFWKGDRPMIDPFVGSGTIPIEAAMIGRNMAPGRRRRFTATDWPQIAAHVWADALAEADDLVRPELDERILGNDTDPRVLAAARFNAEAAGVAGSVHFETRDFHDLTSSRKHGCVITNPPYGERLGEHWDLRPLYESIPTVLAGLPTWSHYLITAYPDFETLVGRAADRRRKLYNGRIECTYYQFHGPKRSREEGTKPPSRPPTPADHIRAAPPVRGDASTSDPSLAALLGTTEAIISCGHAAVEPDGDHAAPASGASVGHARAADDEAPIQATPSGDPKETSGEVTGESTRPVESDSPPDHTPVALDPPSERVPVSPGPAPVSSGPAPALPPAFGHVEAATRQQAELFARRLRKLARHLRRYPTRQGITSYRIYERDVAEVPLVVDRYEDHLHLIEYDRPHSRNPSQHQRWIDTMATTARDTLGIEPGKVFFKRKHRQRGDAQHDKVDDQKMEVLVQEGGLKFIVNLSDYVDTGLFLDHRITRAMVREEARGKSVLNLFAYTGSFTAYAADGGADATTTVDWSNTYLNWARRNLYVNQLDDPRHDFVRRGTMDFLRDHPVEPTYDLVVVDPPTFSNSKRTEDVWDIQHRYVEMFDLLIPLVRSGGTIYFSTNFKRFKFDDTLLMPIESCHEISRQTVPPEYRNKRIHRCWKMTVR